MATRRNVRVTEEKPAYNQSAEQTPLRKSNTSPAVPTPVIVKLLIFSLAMVVLPLGTYFMTVDRVFNGMYLFGAFAILLGGFQLEFFATTGSGEIGWAFAKSFIGSTTWAGASAAIMANVVLIGYIIVAMMEDQGDREEEARTKKGL